MECTGPQSMQCPLTVRDLLNTAVSHTAAISGSSADCAASTARWLADTYAMRRFSAETYARTLATTMSSFAPLPENVRVVGPPCPATGAACEAQRQAGLHKFHCFNIALQRAARAAHLSMDHEAFADGAVQGPHRDARAGQRLNALCHARHCILAQLHLWKNQQLCQVLVPGLAYRRRGSAACKGAALERVVGRMQ